MKKIINGKKYDTDTASHVAHYESEYSVTDWHWYEEDLYRKRTGEYFLHGCGNGLSPYAERYGNMYGEGENIIPLTYEDATAWAERYMDVDEYEAEFGEVAEDDSRTAMTISLSISEAEKIRKAAKKAGVTISEIITSKFLTS